LLFRYVQVVGGGGEGGLVVLGVPETEIIAPMLSNILPPHAPPLHPRGLPADLDWQASGVTARQWAGCMGNAMSLNVLCHLIPEVLATASLVSDPVIARLRKSCADKWGA